MCILNAFKKTKEGQGGNGSRGPRPFKTKFVVPMLVNCSRAIPLLKFVCCFRACQLTKPRANN